MKVCSILILKILNILHIVQKILDKEGLAASRLDARLRMYLNRREGLDGQK